VLHGHVEGGQVHLGGLSIDGAGHLVEGEAATAYVRPHDVHVSVSSDGGEVKATVERRSTLGWLSQLTLRLTDEETIVAHVPNEEIAGVEEGDAVWVDLRNPKAFARRDGESPDLVPEPVSG
jgi:sulfate transport system ATP-binding protein